MKKLPDLDLYNRYEHRKSLVVNEAKRLNIPIIAILDTNSDPTDINFPSRK